MILTTSRDLPEAKYLARRFNDPLHNTPGPDIENGLPEPTSYSEMPKLEQDPRGLLPTQPGAKLDQGKNQVWLMLSGFSRALEEVAKVTTVGATKYSRNGWAVVENGQERYMEAFGRHLLEVGKGNIMDDGPSGTGCMHKGQMIWNLLASLELELREKND